MVRVKEAASIFSVSTRTIFRWIENGTLNAVKIGHTVLISEEEIERLKRGK